VVLQLFLCLCSCNSSRTLLSFCHQVPLAGLLIQHQSFNRTSLVLIVFTDSTMAETANGSTATFTPKNILVTGGCGFIASHVVIRLVKNYPQYKASALRGKAGTLAAAGACQREPRAWPATGSYHAISLSSTFMMHTCRADAFTSSQAC
jgi:hypothetical protein